MLQINDLSLGFGGQELLDDVSFNIHSGERIGLVGRNGSGKTTLLRLITGEVKPDEGRITLPKNYTVGYLKQQLKFTEPAILQEACLGLKAEEKDETWKAEKILSGLGFSEDDFYKSPEEFSGGFQVRLNPAKVLLGEPHLLLLDEPTNYLDIVSIRWFMRFLQRWQNELMIITHDRDFMNSVTTHTMAIHRRKIKKIEGGTVKLFEQIAVEEEVYEKTRRKDNKKREEAMEFINRFRALAGELQPQKGQINRHASCQLGYFGQTNIERLNPDLTIEKEFSKTRPDMNYTDIRKTCGAMMFTGDLALKKIAVLSGGEKSRVSLGKILLSPANLLLLDEPTNHLDVESCDSMIAALDEFPGAVIIVTHSEMFLHHLADRLIVFNEDRVSVFEGTYQDFLDEVGWEPAAKKKQPSKKALSADAEYHKNREALITKTAEVEKMIDDEAHGHQEVLDAGYAELEKLIAELDALDSGKPS